MNSDKGDAHSTRFSSVPTWVAPAVAAVVLILIPLLLFAALAGTVAEEGSFGFDQPVMMWVHDASTQWLTTAAHAASFLGGGAVRVAAVVIAVVLCARRRVGGAFLVLAAVVGASRLNVALKAAFERSRPDFWEHLSVENTSSFPSGHAMGSMSIAAPLVVLAWGTRYRWAALVLAVVYVVAVGASRIYLGVHFPSDVLAGWCLTVLWVGVIVVFLSLLTHWIRQRAPQFAEWV